jgi:hypothetical protein
MLGGISSAFVCSLLLDFLPLRMVVSSTHLAICFTIVSQMMPASFVSGMNITEHTCSGKVFFCSAAAVAEYIGWFFATCYSFERLSFAFSAAQDQDPLSVLYKTRSLLIGKKVLDFETVAAVL